MTTAQEALQMLENETVWETAVHCHAVLREAQVPHAILGGIAVCLHGYRRTTVDLDLLVRREDQEQIRTALERVGYVWSVEHAEYCTPGGVPVQFLLTGDRAGRDSEIRLPDPSEAATIVEIEGLPVLSLARLIEAKLACGLGSPRRLHRDLADVLELIAMHGLGSSFARHLHKSLRPAFRKLVEQSKAE